MNFFDHKNPGNHLLQLCPKVVKHPVYIYIYLAPYHDCSDLATWVSSLWSVLFNDAVSYQDYTASVMGEWLYSIDVKMAGKTWSSRRKTCPIVPCIHHKSHANWPAIEPGPSRWRAGESWHDSAMNKSCTSNSKLHVSVMMVDFYTDICRFWKKEHSSDRLTT